MHVALFLEHIRIDRADAQSALSRCVIELSSRFSAAASCRNFPKRVPVSANPLDEINLKDLKRWLRKSAIIQWDSKNIVKRKGKLVRLM